MKKALQASLIGMVFAFTAFPACADVNDIMASDRALEFKVGGGYLKYGETSNGVTQDTEKGWMPLVGGGITWLAPTDMGWLSNIYLHADLQAMFGDTQYKGSLLNLNTGVSTPYQGTTNDQIYTTSFKAGRAFALGNSLMLTPLIDFDYRFWQRNGTGPGGYQEYYQNEAVMGGLLLQASPMPHLVLSLLGEGGNTIGANVKAKLPGLSDQHNNMGEQTAWRVSGKVGYTFTPQFEWTVGGGLDGFGFGKSNTVCGISLCAQEPASYTHELTVTTGLAYHL